MAEETLSRGHDVSVFSGEHTGDLNGVKLTSDPQILINQSWDLIVVHGADVSIQDIVLTNSHLIPSPILYMLILPSNTPAAMHGIKYSKYVSCSSQADWTYCVKNGITHKSVNIPHGLKVSTSIGTPGFKEKYGITGKMFLSCGGYWPNKAMKELVQVWKDADIDGTLVLTGYDNRHGLMPTASNNVIPLMIEDRSDVINAIYEADCYLMHSFKEGYGLVLIEAMMNKTSWIARNIAGAAYMKDYGSIYNTDSELIDLLKNFNSISNKIESAYTYAMNNHTIKNTVDQILSLI